LHRSIDDFYIPPPRTYHGRGKPPKWLLAMLGLCIVCILVFVSTRFPGEGAYGVVSSVSPAETISPVISPSEEPSDAPAISSPAEPLDVLETPSPTLPTPTQEPSPVPEPIITPEPVPTLDASAVPAPTPVSEPAGYTPVPLGQTQPQTWFSDAVFVGDSRTDGFRMYSGVSEADYLEFTGLSVYDVANGKPVIRSGATKISVLEALAQKQYGKVYISLGVNELGYGNPNTFAQTYGAVIDQIRLLQPNATIYIQTIIPVNTEECAVYHQASYVNNEMIRQYNAALTEMAGAKQIPFVDVAEVLTDPSGELPSEISSDGVHFQKKGYTLWRDYLLCHTGA